MMSHMRELDRSIRISEPKITILMILSHLLIARLALILAHLYLTLYLYTGQLQSVVSSGWEMSLLDDMREDTI